MNETANWKVDPYAAEPRAAPTFGTQPSPAAHPAVLALLGTSLLGALWARCGCLTRSAQQGPVAVAESDEDCTICCFPIIFNLYQLGKVECLQSNSR